MYLCHISVIYNSHSSVTGMVSVILDDDLKAVKSVLMWKDQVFYAYMFSEGVGDVLLAVART